MKRILLTIALVSVMVVMTNQIAFAAPNLNGNQKVHYVAYGESLLGIAVHYGVTTEAIAYANGLADEDFIYVGQKLIIPGNNTYYEPACAKHHTVKMGETLSGIAWYYGTTIKALANLNGLYNTDIVYEGAKLCVAEKAPHYHVKHQPKKHKVKTPDKYHKPKGDNVYLRLGRNVAYEYWGKPERGLDDCSLDWYDDNYTVKRLTVEVLLTNKSDKVLLRDWATPGNVVLHLGSGGDRYPCIHRYGYGQKPRDSQVPYDSIYPYPGDTKPHETVNVTYYSHIEKSDMVTIIEFKKFDICFDVSSGDKVSCKEYGYGGY